MPTLPPPQRKVVGFLDLTAPANSEFAGAIKWSDNDVRKSDDINLKMKVKLTNRKQSIQITQNGKTSTFTIPSYAQARGWLRWIGSFIGLGKSKTLLEFKLDTKANAWNPKVSPSRGPKSPAAYGGPATDIRGKYPKAFLRENLPEPQTSNTAKKALKIAQDAAVAKALTDAATGINRGYWQAPINSAPNEQKKAAEETPKPETPTPVEVQNNAGAAKAAPPRGLPNPNNRCYLNSLLQWLIKTPLMDQLIAKLKEAKEDDEHAAASKRNIGERLAAVKEAYANKNSTADMGKLTEDLIEALSAIRDNNDLPAILKPNQQQRDALDNAADKAAAKQQLIADLKTSQQDAAGVLNDLLALLTTGNERAPYGIMPAGSDGIQMPDVQQNARGAPAPLTPVTRDANEGKLENLLERQKFTPEGKHLLVTIGGELSDALQVPTTLKNNDKDFELKSFVHYNGVKDGSGGHYKMYTKEGDDWYEINDATVTRVENIEDVLGAAQHNITLAHYQQATAPAAQGRVA